jgi:peptidoglycan/xylan/chitin deacetylase (PgdA/CDA1 family)
MKKILYVSFCCVLAALLISGSNSVRATAQPTSTPAHIPEDTVVSLTFDDGNTDNFDIEPLLKANGLHATFYIPSGLVGSQGHMTWDQLQALQKDGNEIGGHSLNHITVRGLDTETLKHQICDDRTNLLSHGLNVISFAYPFGSYDDNAKRMVRDCGYADARIVRGDAPTIPPIDPYILAGFPYIVDDTDLGKLERYVSGTRKDGGGWVILIFHHVCNSCDYYSVTPDILNAFIPWLTQQRSKGNVNVMTVGEVMH